MTSSQQAQILSDTNGAVLTLEKSELDFGTIEEGSNKIRCVKFTNTGKSNLLIDTCLGSCGCTAPRCPQNIAIGLGETRELKISCDTSRLGYFNKTVTIRSKPVMETI